VSDFAATATRRERVEQQREQFIADLTSVEVEDLHHRLSRYVVPPTRRGMICLIH
jgi:hypothetical protein